MSTTGTILINSALGLIGVLASGETPNSDETADALLALQQLMASFSANELADFATRTETIATAASTQSYAFAGARPKKILSADYLVAGINTPVQVLGPEGWAARPGKALTAPQVEAIYCDYAYPTVAVLVAPIPTAIGSLRLYCTVDFQTMATVGTSFDMPEGYERMVKYNLAVDLCPIFNRPCPPEVAAIAASSKASLIEMVASNKAGKSKLEVPPVPPEVAQ
jgi:hypothetical protein